MTNKLLGLLIVYAATNVAFSTWMLVSYFKTVPIELDEAARVDGASSFLIFWNIILPLIVPGIAAVAIFILFSGWNEYMYSSVLISNDDLKTLTVGIISLNSQYQIKWNDLMAASTVSVSYTHLDVYKRQGSILPDIWERIPLMRSRTAISLNGSARPGDQSGVPGLCAILRLFCRMEGCSIPRKLWKD